MTLNLVEILMGPTCLLYSLPPRDAGLCLAATHIHSSFNNLCYADSSNIIDIMITKSQLTTQTYFFSF